MKEIPGPATNVSGYYALLPASKTAHNPRATYITISQSNTITDSAGWDNQPAPSRYNVGHMEWNIPYEFKVIGSDKTYRPFNILQTFDMMDSTGKCSVAKFGLKQPE